MRVSRGRCASSVRLELEREESRSARLAEACVRLQLCMITCGVFGPGSDSTYRVGDKVCPSFGCFCALRLFCNIVCGWREGTRGRGAPAARAVGAGTRTATRYGLFRRRRT